jgi:hypothetical protein
MGEIEFDAAVNGESIPIPAAYKEQMKGEFKILAFRKPEGQEKRQPFIPTYLANTKGLTFNREADYER